VRRGYLLDTNVLSATAPDRRESPDTAKQAAREWIKAHEGILWLPITAIAEIAAGIGQREGNGATRHAGQLSAWLRSLLAAYPDRILTFGIAEALCCRQLGLTARQSCIQPGFADMSVASIAIINDLIVATRNTRHFSTMGAEVVNPFTQRT